MKLLKSNPPDLSKIPGISLIMLEPPGSYRKAVWTAICCGLVCIMLGATNMAVLVYSLNTGDAHAFICTFAYHFFSAVAILSLNPSGWSSPMKLRHRKFTHVLLQILAMATAICGTTIIIINNNSIDGAHAVSGVVAAVLSGFSLLSGPCALFGGYHLRRFHVFLGIPTFATFSICLGLGIFTDKFSNFAGQVVKIVLTVFIVFYTFFIMVTVCIRCSKMG